MFLMGHSFNSTYPSRRALPSLVIILKIYNSLNSTWPCRGRRRGCARVKEILGETDAGVVSSENMTQVVAHVDELLEIDPQDARHLFWEEMKRIFFAMQEVQLEDLDEETMDEFMATIDGVSNVLYRIEKRRRRREGKIEKLRI